MLKPSAREDENGRRLFRTVPESCDLIRCGPTTLYKLIAQKKIEAVKLNGRTLVLEESLQSLPERLPKVA